MATPVARFDKCRTTRMPGDALRFRTTGTTQNARMERLPEPTGFEFVDFDDDYWDWSANWWDRYKSSDFLSTAQEIIRRESQWP